MIVSLSKFEYSDVLEFVNARGVYKRNLGIPRDSGDSTGIVFHSKRAYELDLLGTLAEFAVGKVLGLVPNFLVKTCGDGGWDYPLGKLKLNVKYSTAKDGHMLFPKIVQVVKADIFVYVEPVESKFEYNVRGVISQKVVLEKLFTTDFGYGRCWAVHHADISSFDQALPWLLKQKEKHGSQKVKDSDERQNP